MYDQWLDSGKQTTTAKGNVRAPSRTDICDMVSEAWGELSEEMIKKSFVVCGQTKDGSPEEITCLKEGRTAHPALEEVKKFWNQSAAEFSNNQHEAIEEIDEDEDPALIESDDEEIE